MCATEFGLLQIEIDEVLAWANALVAIGNSPNMIETGAIRVIGYSLNSLTEAMQDWWTDAH